jgi:hypothetical protein
VGKDAFKGTLEIDGSKKAGRQLKSGSGFFILRDLVIMGGFPMGELVTASEIASRIDEPVERVRYFLTVRNIEPVRRAGLVRLFDPSVVEIIKSACYNMQIRQ